MQSKILSDVQCPQFKEFRSSLGHVLGIRLVFFDSIGKECGVFKSIFIIASVLVVLSASASASEKTGSVCLGPNLSVVWGDSDHVTISIGKIKGIRFSKDNAPKIVASGLNLTKSYEVVIFYDGEPVESWELNFQKLGSRMAYIWRAKGGYRMNGSPPKACGN